MTIPPTLAAALRDATVEQLREDAKLCAVLIKLRPGDSDPMFRRLAALALAVAAWQERPARLSRFDNSWDDDGHAAQWALRRPMTMHYDHFVTLPAALAALLEAE